jgi:hypothetical protein
MGYWPSALLMVLQPWRCRFSTIIDSRWPLAKALIDHRSRVFR